MKNLILILSLFFASNSWGQSFEEDAKSLIEHNKNIQSISMDMHLTFYDAEDPEKLISSAFGKHIQKGSKYRLEFPGILSMQNRYHQFVKVDSSLSMMIGPKMEIDYMEMSQLPIEELVQSLDSFELLSNSEISRSYRLFVKPNPLLNFRVLDLSIDLELNMITSCQMYINEKWSKNTDENEQEYIPIAKFDFKNIKLNEEISDSFFDMDKYVLLENSGWKTKKNFSNFELIDLYQKTQTR